MIAPKVKKANIIAAMDYIDRNGLPTMNRSRTYQLIADNGKRYPPKYVVALADHLANGTDIQSVEYNSIIANSVLKRLGFVVEAQKDVIHSERTHLSHRTTKVVGVMKNKFIDEEKLKRAIDSVINEGPVSIKAENSLSDWLALKHAVSPINNYITHELTMIFITHIAEYLDYVKEDDVTRLIDKYSKENVNANGFDVKDDKLKIVGEIKANVPYGGDRYGAAQLAGLKKDVNGMLHGKSKDQTAVEDYLKFLIVLDYNTNTYSTKSAIESFASADEMSNKTRVLKTGEKLTFNDNKEIVYIVSLGDNYTTAI